MRRPGVSRSSAGAVAIEVFNQMKALICRLVAVQRSVPLLKSESVTRGYLVALSDAAGAWALAGPLAVNCQSL